MKINADHSNPSEFGRRIQVLLMIVMALIAGLAIVLTVVWLRTGSIVAVKNWRPTIVKDVVIRVSGETIRLGDIATDETRCRKIRVAGDPQIEIEFINSMGVREHKLLESRLDPANRLDFRIYISDGNVVTNPPTRVDIFDDLKVY